MYLAMARVAHREGYPEIGLYWEKAAYEASSRAISWTVSWIASRPFAFASFASSVLPRVAPFSASTLISRFFFVVIFI